MKAFSLTTAVALALLAPSLAEADEPAPPKITTVASNLDNPRGVAIQPGTGVVFVAESGAGRIVRLTTEGAVEVIGGLPTKAAPSDKGTQLGPLALAFPSRSMLAVGGASVTAGSTPLRFYELPASQEKQSAEKVKHAAALAPPADKKLTATGDIVALATDGAGHLALASSDAEQADRNWLGKIDVADDRVGAITPILGTDGHQPRALTLSPRGEWVTAEKPAGSKSEPSLLTFYNPQTKKVLLRLEVGLRDVTGLAYSPRTGWLYASALDQDKSEGGFFRLDRALVDGKPGVKAVLITKLQRPSGITFAPNGALYVTLLGKSDTGAKEKPGSVVRLTGRM